jgi:hypothetical protein
MYSMIWLFTINESSLTFLSINEKGSEGVYMKIRQTLLIGITVMFLATGNAWAEDNGISRNEAVWFSQSTFIHFWQQKFTVLRNKVQGWRNTWLIGDSGPGQSYVPASTGGVTRGVAPEIDAASGTQAIALLTGVLLLAAERTRSRPRRA